MQQFYNVADTLIVGRFLGASRIDELKNNLFISFVLTGILAAAIVVSDVCFFFMAFSGDWVNPVFP